MILQPAKCPCCGAGITVPAGQEKVVCPYCDTQILVQAAIAYQKVSVEVTVHVEKPDFDIRGGVLVRYCGKSAKVEVPEGVKIIGKDCFRGLSVELIALPDSVEEIREGAFRDCLYLKTINIPEAIFEIQPRTFRGCGSLKRLEFPAMVEIYEEAFYECFALEELLFASPPALIHRSAFQSCSSLKHFDGSKCCSIDESAFAYCSALQSITFAQDEVSIGKNAFLFCDSLQELILPAKVSPDHTVLDRDYTWGTFRSLQRISVGGIELDSSNAEDVLSGRMLKITMFKDTPWFQNIMKLRRERETKGLCVYCGDPLTFWGRKCKKCGKKYVPLPLK